MPVYTYLYIFTVMICVYEIDKFYLSFKITYKITFPIWKSEGGDIKF